MDGSTEHFVLLMLFLLPCTQGTLSTVTAISPTHTTATQTDYSPLNASHPTTPSTPTSARPNMATSTQDPSSSLSSHVSGTTARPQEGDSTSNTAINTSSLPTTPAQSTLSQDRCSSPPVLCCLGQSSSCRRRSCFCDQACVLYGDCCHDYRTTCTQQLGSTWTLQATHTVPAVSNLVQTITSHSDDTTGNTTPSVTTTLIQNTVSKETTETDHKNIITSHKDTQTLIAHLRVSIVSAGDISKEEIIEALHHFAAQVQAFLQREYCNNCTLRIRNVRGI
ncbi:mucin-4 isoform X2 [Oncorhynchus keta]|uniref:mucin-4 isoform X2 n=1 Tax=Oncorhynchus keta TaxID=8018 RepID=UPI00227AD2A1|nr:mucin-4 isoform X2 [Oncorhynchus keta]